MNRISRQQMFMDIAWVVARRSTCMRLNVGAVVVVKNNIASIGYNGSPSGAPHCWGNDCPGKDGCHLTIHAEENALRRAQLANSTKKKDLYITHSPCHDCCLLMMQAHVERLFFAVPYRITDHLEQLRPLMPVYQVTPAGYILDWFSKVLVNDLRT